MSTVEIDAETKPETSPIDTIKTLMTTLTEQMATQKTMLNTLRGLLKETEKSSKELDKYRNKRNGKAKNPRSADALPSGITKPVAISDELAKFLGVAPGTLVPRNEVTKGVSGFVKSNELSDPSNKQKFILDDRPAAKTLRALLGNPTEDVTYFNLQRYLKHHYIQLEQSKTPRKAVVVKDEPAAVPESASAAPVLKKKILVKKKQVSELTEEA
jgi:chromatin remodeling complex protein RSC6